MDCLGLFGMTHGLMTPSSSVITSTFIELLGCIRELNIESTFEIMMLLMERNHAPVDR